MTARVTELSNVVRRTAALMRVRHCSVLHLDCVTSVARGLPVSAIGERLGQAATVFCHVRAGCVMRLVTVFHFALLRVMLPRRAVTVMSFGSTVVVNEKKLRPTVEHGDVMPRSVVMSAWPLWRTR